MEKIMVDTSAIYALLDRSDNNHLKAKNVLTKISEVKGQVFLTNFIVAETHSLILGRLGHELAREWMRSIYWPVERVSAEDEKSAFDIVLSYKDKSFSFTDAATFAVMNRLEIPYYFGFDSHFKQFGFLEVVLLF